MATRGISFEVHRTPPDRRAPGSPEQVPVLQLRRFAPTPKVSFGTVKLGATRTVGIIVQNPGDAELELFVEKVPEGFSVDSDSLVLPALMDCVLAVHWTPEAEGNVRAVLGLRTSTGVRCQAILLGTGRPLNKDKKRKSVASAPGSKFRKPQPLRTLNSSSAGRPTAAASAKSTRPVPGAPRASERENRAPRVAAALTNAGRQLAQPTGLLCPPTAVAGPLNSTHRLETSADTSTLLDVLRTPPDFSVSLIRSEDAPSTPARRRDGRAARLAAASTAPVQRRNTFEAPMGCTFRLDPPSMTTTPPEPGELPPCTVPESPLRRQTFIRTDGPTLGSAPSASVTCRLDPVAEANGESPTYARDDVFETPQLFRRRLPVVAQESGGGRQTEVMPGRRDGEDWMPTPALFGKTVTRQSHGGERREERSERSERREERSERHERSERREERIERSERRYEAAAEQAERSRQSTRQTRRSAGQAETSQTTKHERTRQSLASLPTSAPSDVWMKTPSLFGRATSRTESHSSETRETREERSETREDSTRQTRLATRGGVRFEVRDEDCFGTHVEERHDTREERRCEVRGEVIRSGDYEEEQEEILERREEIYQEEYEEVYEEERIEVREERFETVQYTEEHQEYVAVQTEDVEHGNVMQTPQLFGGTRTRSRREPAPASPPVTPVMPQLRAPAPDRASEPSRPEPETACSGSAREALMAMPTPQLFGRTVSVASAVEAAQATTRRATRSEMVSTTSSVSGSGGGSRVEDAVWRDKRASCVHEELVEEETLIRHVFSREVDPTAVAGESPRLLRSRRTSRTEETRRYASPVRGGRPDVASVLGSPVLPRTPTVADGGGRRCSTLVKETTAAESPSAAVTRSAAAKQLFSVSSVGSGDGGGGAGMEQLHVDIPDDASSDVSGNMSSETYVKSPAPASAGLAVPCVSPSAAHVSWSGVGTGALSLIREESENVTAASARNLTYSLEETREEEAAAAEALSAREAHASASADSVATSAHTGGSSTQETQSNGSDGSWATVDGFSTMTGPATEEPTRQVSHAVPEPAAHTAQRSVHFAQDKSKAEPQREAEETQQSQAETKSHVQRPTGLLFFPLSPESAEPPPPPAPRQPVQPSARAMAVAAARRSVSTLSRREAAGRSQSGPSPPRAAPRRAARTPNKPRARRPSLTVTPGKSRAVRTRSSPTSASGSSTGSRAGASHGRRSVPAPVRQKRLTLTSRSAKPVATQPNPFAASNMFYDKDWVEKQERGFTAWLNFILTPSQFSSNVVETKVDAAKILLEVRGSRVPPAPSRETLSLREYTAQRRLNRLRLDACRLYERPEMTRVIRNLEVEVERGGLRVRRDRALHADMGLKQLVMQWLLSYHPLWLRLGLETIYGEIIHLQGPDDLATLARFINTRLLWSPDLAARHRHPSVPHLYGPQFEPELKQFTLKKFLLLVLLLDTAKRHRLINHDPCLFNKYAAIKASRDLLVAFSREMLAGEGDITKHLSFHGYQVSHRQTLLDEFNYAVTNVATDLRCGVRLTRVVELLRGEFGLTTQLRVPAVDRQQKIHNSRIAVRHAGLELEPDVWARALVDGHREKTLHLLWLLVFRHQIDTCLDVEKLRREVARLETSLDNSCFIGVEEAIEGRRQLRALCEADPAADVTGGGDGGLPDSESLRLLTRWTRLVCAHYGLPVHNLSASFGDGRAYCHLVHHYQPTLLPRGNIREQTSQTAHRKGSSTADAENLDDSLTFSYSRQSESDDTRPAADELRRNEKHNLNAAFDAMSELGGVPVLSTWTDYSATLPDRRLVAVTLAYLCGRLLELGTEVAAARTLQLWWRRRRLAALRRRQQAEDAAARVLQRHARTWLERRRAARRLLLVVRLQAAARGWLVRRHMARRAAAATTIARRYRALQTARRERAELARRREAAERIQRWWRHLQLRFRCGRVAALLSRYLAAARIQRWWRGLCAGAAARTELRLKRRSVVTLQRWYRSVRVVRAQRSVYLRQRSAAVTVQSWYRAVREGNRQRREYLTKRAAALTIQTQYRAATAMRRQRDEFTRQKTAVVTIQVWYRAVLAMRRDRAEFVKRRTAALTIQAWVRAMRAGHKERTEFLAQKTSAVAIQSWYRAALAGRKERAEFLRKKTAALKIQTWLRATLAAREERARFLQTKTASATLHTWCRSVLAMRRTRDEFLRRKRAAVLIQAWYRSILARDAERARFLRLKTAAVTIQIWHRSLLAMRSDRDAYIETRQAVVAIQGWYRSILAMRRDRAEFLAKKTSAQTIQMWYRSLLEMRKERIEFLQKRQAASVLQARFRAAVAMKRERTAYQEQKRAAVTVQTWYRSVILARTVREKYLTQRRAVIVLQSKYRAALAMRRERKSFLTQKRAACVLQSRYRALTAMRRQRRAYLDQLRAATTIQLGYRAAMDMRRDRASFLRLKTATTVLQHRYRALRAMRTEREAYLKRKAAAVMIQAWWHSILARNRDMAEFQRQKWAAVVLQTRYRALRDMRETREEFQRQKWAAVVLQTRFSALLSMRVTREQFQREKWAAIVLQTRYRALRTMRVNRDEFLRQGQAATTLQTRYRALRDMRETRSEFQRQKWAVVVLQTRYRALRTMRVTREQFQREKWAATVLQTRYRALRKMRGIRKEFQRQKWAVIVLQTRYRALRDMRVNRDEFLRQRQAATVLQTRYRALRDMRMTREEFLREKWAAVVLQIRFRALLAMRANREEFLCQRQAATTLQARYRALQAMRVTRHNFSEQKRAAMILQTRYRAMRAMRVTRQNFLQEKKAAIILQTHYRALRSMRVARETFAEQKHAAITIQTHYRALLAMRAAREEYLQQHRAVITLQTYYRSVRAMRAERESYRTQRGSVIAIQTWYRSLLAMRKEREAFLRRREAAVTLQGWRRALVIMRRERSEFVAQREAAVTLQRWYRSRREVKKQQAKLKETVLKITLVQSCVRTFIVRRRFVAQRRAAVTLQRSWRAVRCARRDREEYLRTRQAAVAIQQWYRAVRAMRTAREEYERVKRATTVIQQWYRSTCLMRRTRDEYESQRQASVIIQTWYRSSCLMRETRDEYLRKKHAVTVLQTWYRSLRAMQETRQEFEKKKEATIILHTWYHSIITMRKTRVQYLKIRTSVIKLQRWYRSVLSARAARDGRSSQTDEVFGHATVTLQRFVGHLDTGASEDGSYDRRSTRTLSTSSCERSYPGAATTGVSGSADRRATVVLERSLLARTASQESQASNSGGGGVDRRATVLLTESYLERHGSGGSCHSAGSDRRATVTLHDSYLMRQASQESTRSSVSSCVGSSTSSCRRETVVLHQSLLGTRAFDVSAAEAALPDCDIPNASGTYDLSPALATTTTTISATAAGNAAAGSEESGLRETQLETTLPPPADDLTHHADADADDGDTFRSRLASQLSPEEECSSRRRTLLLQWEMARRDPARAEARRTAAVVTIQRVVRRFLYRRRLERRRVAAAVVLQTQIRRVLARRAAQRRLWAVVTLQAAWRGRTERRRAGRRAACARQNIAAANRRATTDMTLGSRTSMSLDFLLRYRDLGHMKVALGHLETTTRLSAVCCRRVVEEGAVPVLYTLMSQCNRSVPHMDVITYCLNVLLNAAKHPETENTVHQAENWLPVLLDKLSIFREKGTHIFVKAATLLTAILRDPFMVQVVLADARAVEQLQSLHRLVARRHQQQQQQQRHRPGQRAGPGAAPPASTSTSELHVGRSRVQEFATPVAAAAGVLAALGITP